MFTQTVDGIAEEIPAVGGEEQGPGENSYAPISGVVALLGKAVISISTPTGSPRSFTDALVGLRLPFNASVKIGLEEIELASSPEAVLQFANVSCAVV